MCGSKISSTSSDYVSYQQSIQHLLLSVDFALSCVPVDRDSQRDPAPHPHTTMIWWESTKHGLADILAMIISFHSDCDEASVIIQHLDGHTKILIATKSSDDNGVHSAINILVRDWWDLISIRLAHQEQGHHEGYTMLFKDKMLTILQNVFAFGREKVHRRLRETSISVEDVDMSFAKFRNELHNLYLKVSS